MKRKGQQTFDVRVQRWLAMAVSGWLSYIPRDGLAKHERFSVRKEGKRAICIFFNSSTALPTDSTAWPARSLLSGFLFYQERRPWLSSHPYTRLLALGLVSGSVRWLRSASRRARSLSAVKARRHSHNPSHCRVWPLSSPSLNHQHT